MDSKKLSTLQKVVIVVLLVASLVPASYIGNLAAISMLVDKQGNGGPFVAIGVVVITAVVLGCVGGAGIAVMKKWNRISTVLVSGAVILLAALSIWMLATLQKAGEGLLVFMVTVIALGLIAAFIKLLEKLNAGSAPSDTEKKPGDNTDRSQPSTEVRSQEVSRVVAAPGIEPTLDQRPDTFLPENGMALVYIYRYGMVGAAVTMSVTVNGRYIGDTMYKSYYRVDVRPGICEIVSQGKKDKGLRLQVEEGKTYYIWQQAKMGLTGGSQLNVMTDFRGKSEIRTCKRLSTPDISAN